MQEQVDIVFEEHELWPFHHIEGGQAQHHAGQDRKHGKNQKNNGKGVSIRYLALCSCHVLRKVIGTPLLCRR